MQNVNGKLSGIVKAIQLEQYYQNLHELETF